MLFAIAVPEIFSTGTNIYSQNFKYFEVLAVVSIWYLALTALLTALAESHRAPLRRRSAQIRAACTAILGRGAGLMALVEIKNVHKRFGDLEVLKGVSLGVETGEVVCFWAPAAAARPRCCAVSTIWRPSMTARSGSAGELVGYARGKDGKLREEKDAITSAKRARIGMVFQRFNLFAHLTVLENVTEAPVQVLRLPLAEARRTALDLLAEGRAEGQGRSLSA